ncbi:hypothetical protein JYU34_012438, partial [Plutella xylostella]
DPDATWFFKLCNMNPEYPPHYVVEKARRWCCWITDCILTSQFATRMHKEVDGNASGK